MFGRVEKEHNNLIAATIAGPNPGVVDRLGYECEIDYRVVLTNGPAGIGTVGVYDCNNLMYTPACCIGTDEDTGEDIKIGVLSVDCVCVRCGVNGTDNADWVLQNPATSNVTYNIPLWGNEGQGEQDCCYYQMMASGTCPLTYNPNNGTLSTTTGVFADRVCVGRTGNCAVYGVCCICAAGTQPFIIQGSSGISIGVHDSGITLGRDECTCIFGNDIYLRGRTYADGCFISCGAMCAWSGLTVCDCYTRLVIYPGHCTYAFGLSSCCIGTSGFTCFDSNTCEYTTVPEACLLSGITKTFNGNLSQWCALTCDERKTYTNVSITNI